jgi:ATP-dependent DNA ligase
MRPYAGRARPVIRDPVIEPYWSGLRMLAHLGAPAAGASLPEVQLRCDGEVDLTAELPTIAAELATAIEAVVAVVDGIVTRQVGLEGVGAAPIAEVRASASAIILRGNADIDIVPRGPGAAADPAEEGFVAVDLLSVDGTDLLDVPLLERKRLLESVVRESERVRVSVLARPPIETWVASWKALGLRGGMLKAANSRYQPGGRSVEWQPVERVGRGSA